MSRKKRILIVDDSPENVSMLAETLSKYDCIVALTGENALEKAQAEPHPDLILLDIVMPGINGFEVCKRLKKDEKTENIPIVFTTGLGEVENEAKGFRLGAVDYVTKPFSPIVIRARVKTHLTLKDARETLTQHNALLEEEVIKRTGLLEDLVTKLKKGSLETTIRLSRAAEYKDEDTGAHILRMSHYSAALAQEIGYMDDFVENLLHAAPLHDVGKIGIPDKILLKPGKLTSEEWDIMRRHCEMGAEILSGSEAEVVRLGETIALTHHEKWDGKGYPKGLSGEDIPISGRIVAIADVFDALTSKRPYKEPFSIEKSFAILKEGKGNHFDPVVVEAFFSIQDQILEIKETYQDTAVSPLVEFMRMGQI